MIHVVVQLQLGELRGQGSDNTPTKTHLQDAPPELLRRCFNKPPHHCRSVFVRKLPDSLGLERRWSQRQVQLIVWTVSAPRESSSESHAWCIGSGPTPTAASATPGSRVRRILWARARTRARFLCNTHLHHTCGLGHQHIWYTRRWGFPCVPHEDVSDEVGTNVFTFEKVHPLRVGYLWKVSLWLASAANAGQISFFNRISWSDPS